MSSELRTVYVSTSPHRVLVNKDAQVNRVERLVKQEVLTSVAEKQGNHIHDAVDVLDVMTEFMDKYSGAETLTYVSDNTLWVQAWVIETDPEVINHCVEEVASRA